MKGPALLLATLAALASSCGDGALGEQPTPLGGRLTQGQAHVVVTGDLEAEFEAPLDPEAPNIFQPPDGGFAVNWADQSAQGMGVGGPLFTGNRETSEAVSLSITVVPEELPVVFASFAGECRVSITTVEEDALAGTFECASLSKGETVIDAEGEFSASG